MADSIVVLTDNVSTVVSSIDVANSTIITSAVQGPAGVSGASSTISYIAGGTISSNSGIILVNATAIQANSSDVTQAGKVIGISTGSAINGSFITIQASGELDGFFNLVVNSKVYLQANGSISSTVPTIGFIQQIGLALTSTKILINIQPSLILG